MTITTLSDVWTRPSLAAGAADPERKDHVRDMVRSLREWVASDFASRLPPARDDPEAALRELLDLLIDVAPKELVLFGALGLEAMEDVPMSADEIALAYFCDDEIQEAFRRVEEPAAV